MNLRKEADRMIVGCQYTGFRHMIASLINIFCISTFRAVSDKAKGFKFVTVWFHHITVIDVNDRFSRSPFTDGFQIRFQCSIRNAFVQMSGKTYYRIDLFGIFMKLVNDICQKAAFRSKHAVGHISSELFVWFGKIFLNFI